MAGETVRVPGDLTGRTAVVTGAARGIGRAAAVALAARGAAMAGLDIAGPVSPILDFAPATAEDLAATGEAIRQAGGRWLQAVADQREMGAADWHDQIEVNLNGTANVLRVFAPLLVRRGGGRIIITSSTQGEHGTKSGAAYSAFKWGLIGTALTRHEDRYAQAISSAGREPSVDAQKDEQTAKQVLTAKTPLGVPWIDPADVAPVVAFLASDEARMVSGASFAVTAGDSANITA